AASGASAIGVSVTLCSAENSRLLSPEEDGCWMRSIAAPNTLERQCGAPPLAAHRREKEPPMSPQPIQPGTIAVVGAGLMGHGIAQVFMAGGWDVAIWDRSPEVLAAVPDRIRGNLAVLGSDIEVRIRLKDTLEEAVAGAQLIVEALPENLDLKRDLVAK